MLAPRVTTTWSSVMNARSPSRMLLSHPSTPPATARIAIRRHPRMILFLAVASVRPNSLLSLCLIYISTLPANAVLVKKPPIKFLQTCRFNHDRSGGQIQASSSAAPAGILVICIIRTFRQNARSNRELFRCKNIHGIRHKLHIFANRLLLRRDIQQSQCRSNHRIKIDSMLCPDVRIHKYLNKHGIQPLRQQPVLTELRHRHAGQ